ncbi:hypothetical protein [Nannocystis pusilla]|uniref:hypothetical protein n=1 Tax=Nannocystis pusilla TaxID=889268 RepID=UPI003B812E06
MTFKIRSTDSVRRMAVSRFFVLRTLAWSRRGDYAICRALKPLLAPLSLHAQGEYLQELQSVDKFIARTRITAIENYIDWENIDHEAALVKMIVAMKLPTSYHLEVFFSDPAHLARIKVGDQLKSEQADGWLKSDPGNIYTFKRDDEHWYLHKLLATHNESGEDVIAWTNAHDTVLDRTGGILPGESATAGAPSTATVPRASASSTTTSTTRTAASSSSRGTAGSRSQTCSAMVAPILRPRPPSPTPSGRSRRAPTSMSAYCARGPAIRRT